MTETDFNSLKQKLLSRMVSGEINREEYDQMLVEIERQASASSIDTQTPNSANQPTEQSSTFQSMGNIPTNFQTAPVLQVDAMLGKYRLTEKLGRGGMGEVWKANDTVGERDVVIKVLPPELSGNPDELARVKDTFKKVHQLNHQYICPTYDLGHDDKIGYYLVMQFIEGVTLAAYRRGIISKFDKFPLKNIRMILGKVAAALDYSHEQKVIHRDLKPENIMISKDGSQVWLIDFGLAAEVQSSMARVSRVEMDRSGTYPYMAPEQWRGEYQDAKTDQYALAVVAYEMATGRLPFEGDRYILERCALNQPFPLIDEADQAFNQSLAKATEKQRTDRFESCAQFITAMTEEVISNQRNVPQTTQEDFNQVVKTQRNKQKSDKVANKNKRKSTSTPILDEEYRNARFQLFQDLLINNRLVDFLKNSKLIYLRIIAPFVYFYLLFYFCISVDSMMQSVFPEWGIFDLLRYLILFVAGISLFVLSALVVVICWGTNLTKRCRDSLADQLLSFEHQYGKQHSHSRKYGTNITLEIDPLYQQISEAEEDRQNDLLKKALQTEYDHVSNEAKIHWCTKESAANCSLFFGIVGYHKYAMRQWKNLCVRLVLFLIAFTVLFPAIASDFGSSDAIPPSIKNPKPIELERDDDAALFELPSLVSEAQAQEGALSESSDLYSSKDDFEDRIKELWHSNFNVLGLIIFFFGICPIAALIIIGLIESGIYAKCTQKEFYERYVIEDRQWF